MKQMAEGKERGVTVAMNADLRSFPVEKKRRWRGKKRERRKREEDKRKQKWEKQKDERAIIKAYVIGR